MRPLQKTTLGFLAGGYRAIAQWKGLTLPEHWKPGTDKLHSLLVGWDAADWRYLYPLLEQGKMPALAQLMEEGVHSKIATLDPPISPMLWTSVATSRYPQDHGIHGFTELHDRTVRAVRGSSRTVPAYWDLIERAGLPAGTIAWWPSHPAVPSANGSIRVSNLAFGASEFWDLGNTFGPWSGLAAQLLIKPEELPPSAVAAFFPELTLDGNDDIFRSVHKIVLHALNVHTMATLAADVQQGGHLSVYYDALDHFKHLGAKYAPPQLQGLSTLEFERYRHIVEAGYRLHDLFLGVSFDYCSPQTHIFLLSDHGFAHGDERVLQLPHHAGAPALEHRHFGIFVSRSSHWSRDLKVSGLGLLDIAPLVLSAHNLPIPVSFEGRKPLAWQGPYMREASESTLQHRDAATVQKQDEPAQEIEGQLLRQLVALGYLSPDHLKTQAARDFSAHGTALRISENDYYLARSLRAQGQSARAWALLQQLVDSLELPAERYGLLGAGLLHDTQQWALLGKWLERQWEEHDAPAWEFYRAVYAISQGQEWTLPAYAHLGVPAAVLWGRLLLRAGKYERLAQLLEQVKARAKAGVDQPDFINLELRLALHNQNWEAAAQLALESLDQAYHQSAVHQALAFALSKMGRLEEAAVARQSADLLRPETTGGSPLFIVTGAPRSGTSLAMQLLQRGGIAPVSDGIREANEHNSQGFFEHEKVRQWSLSAQWLEAQRGKAIKIVLPLLKNAPLPQVPLVVVRMRREWSAVTRSQRRMLNETDKPLAFDEVERWSKAWEDTAVLFHMRPSTHVITLDFEALLAVGHTTDWGEDGGLEEGMRQLNKWLPKPLSLEDIREIVRPSMRHF